MTKPDDIPAEVWEKATAIVDDLDCDWSWHGTAIAEMAEHDGIDTIARSILSARAEQREEDARILLDYPPDEFFEILWNMTARDDEGDPFWKLQGDTGNWAAHMIKLLAPYAAAIRNGGK